MALKGTLLLIGGGEYKGNNEHEKHKDSTPERSPLSIFCREPWNNNIEIITTGTSYPREAFEAYENFFGELGVKNITMLDLDSRNVKDEHSRRIEEASAVFISGGNQRKILEIVAGTSLEDILRDRMMHDKDFLLAGTSAGAMTLSELTIGDGFYKQSLLKGDVDIRNGMKMLPKVIVDTHFILSQRLARLSLALLENRNFLGVGLSDNTGVLVKKGEILEHVGQEMVVILDPSEIDDTNVDDAVNGAPVFAQGMKMHFMHEGCQFSLKTRKLSVTQHLLKK